MPGSLIPKSVMSLPYWLPHVFYFCPFKLVDFGKLFWALPSFWCKMRGGLRIGASPLLISVLVVRCRDRGPPFAYPLLMSRLFFTDALNEIGA